MGFNPILTSKVKMVRHHFGRASTSTVELRDALAQYATDIEYGSGSIESIIGEDGTIWYSDKDDEPVAHNVFNETPPVLTVREAHEMMRRR